MVVCFGLYLVAIRAFSLFLVSGRLWETLRMLWEALGSFGEALGGFGEALAGLLGAS